MKTSDQYRLPFAPLESYGLRNTGMAALMGKQINLARWRRLGLTLKDADALSVALRVQPDDIWGEAWEEACESYDERHHTRAAQYRLENKDRIKIYNARHALKRKLRANQPAVLV